MNISFPSASTSFTSRFFGTYWRQRIVCALTRTSAARPLMVLAAGRLPAARLKQIPRMSTLFAEFMGTVAAAFLKRDYD